MNSLTIFQRIRNPKVAKKLLKSMKQHKGQIYGKASIQDVGINLNKLTHFTKSYDNLVVEQGRVIKGLPTRLRRYANFTITKAKYENLFQQNEKTEFKQDVSDERKETRIFHPMEKHLLEDEIIKTMLSNMTDMVWEIHPDVIELEMSLHQVRILSYPTIIGDNAPEGIHQDGADVIVPVIVFNRSPHIKGGVSRIYDDDAKTLIDETIVKEGEFNFMQDRVLWHDVTKLILDSSEGNKIGYRDILGIDWIITKRTNN